MDKVFLERYNRLNKAQKEAVDTIDGPVMVIAGPGTGKTTILTLRIANILRQTDTPASGILAITFTDSGVKSMKQKLREIIGSRADEVKIHTFHSFAASMISEFKEYFVHLSDAVQMTDIDQVEMIKDILTDNKFKDLRPFGNSDFYIDHLLGMIRDAKRDAVTPEMLADFAETEKNRIENDDASISTRGATKGQLKADAKNMIKKCDKTILASEVYKLYEDRKQNPLIGGKKMMDFDDLIGESLKAMRENELLLRSLQEKYLYIHVDEHQDTNDSQNMIIKLLAEFFDSPNVFIVGDEKQAIYRFQGASVDNFLRFESIWTDMKVISLVDNYRSSQSILDASFSMIESNYEDDEHQKLRIKLISGNSQTLDPVEIVTAGNIIAAENYLTESIKRITQKEPNATIALISRTNSDVEKAVRACNAEGIEVSSERNIDIFNHPMGLLFFALIEFISDPLATHALLRTIVGGLWNLDFTLATELLQRIRKQGVSGIDTEISALTEIRQELVSDSPIEFIMHAASKSGYVNIASKDPYYVEVWRGILTFVETIIRQSNSSDPITIINKLLQYRDRAEQKMVKVAIGSHDSRIVAMTAHSSKGLEFDYVFIPYATEESWKPRARNTFFIMPMQRLVHENDDVRDARRLFYVALTRAKKHITLCVPESLSDGVLLTPLRFIQELDRDSVVHTNIPSQETAYKQSDLHKSKNDKLTTYIKRVLNDSGLSVTALNNFIECPNKFIFKSIFKIPEAPSLSAEKGNALHKAFARIWADSNKTLSHIQEIIENTVREHISDTLLRSYDKQALIDELIQDAPDIANSLLSHFAQEGTQFIEGPAEYELKNELQNIRLHGRLDAVIDTGDRVLVFDYKTTDKKSENEIKGLNKSEGFGARGAYFRQLVFYKILLEHDFRFKGKEIIPSLVFVKPDNKGMCHIMTFQIAEEDIKVVKDEINSLINSVYSGSILSDKCDDNKCNSCSLRRLI